MYSKNLKNNDLSSISGGKSSDGKFCDMKNPYASMSREEAEKFANDLPEEGEDMGSWKKMSRSKFWKLWRSYHPNE